MFENGACVVLNQAISVQRLEPSEDGFGVKHIIESR
jgi:hypothetical protein